MPPGGTGADASFSFGTDAEQLVPRITGAFNQILSAVRGFEQATKGANGSDFYPGFDQRVRDMTRQLEELRRAEERAINNAPSGKPFRRDRSFVADANRIKTGFVNDVVGDITKRTPKDPAAAADLARAFQRGQRDLASSLTNYVDGLVKDLGKQALARGVQLQGKVNPTPTGYLGTRATSAGADTVAFKSLTDFTAKLDGILKAAATTNRGAQQTADRQRRDGDARAASERTATQRRADASVGRAPSARAASYDTRSLGDVDGKIRSVIDKTGSAFGSLAATTTPVTNATAGLSGALNTAQNATSALRATLLSYADATKAITAAGAGGRGGTRPPLPPSSAPIQGPQGPNGRGRPGDLFFLSDEYRRQERELRDSNRRINDPFKDGQQTGKRVVSTNFQNFLYDFDKKEYRRRDTNIPVDPARQAKLYTDLEAARDRATRAEERANRQAENIVARARTEGGQIAGAHTLASGLRSGQAFQVKGNLFQDNQSGIPQFARQKPTGGVEYIDRNSTDERIRRQYSEALKAATAFRAKQNDADTKLARQTENLATERRLAAAETAGTARQFKSGRYFTEDVGTRRPDIYRRAQGGGYEKLDRDANPAEYNRVRRELAADAERQRRQNFPYEQALQNREPGVRLITSDTVRVGNTNRDRATGAELEAGSKQLTNALIAEAGAARKVERAQEELANYQNLYAKQLAGAARHITGNLYEVRDPNGQSPSEYYRLTQGGARRIDQTNDPFAYSQAQNQASNLRPESIGGGFLRGLTSAGFGGNTGSGFNPAGLAQAAGNTVKFSVLYDSLNLVQQGLQQVIVEIANYEDSIANLELAYRGSGEASKDFIAGLSGIAQVAGVNLGDVMDQAAIGMRAFSDAARDASGNINKIELEKFGTAFAGQVAVNSLITGNTYDQSSSDVRAAASAFQGNAGTPLQESDFTRINDAITGAKDFGGDANDISKGVSALATAGEAAGLNINQIAAIVSQGTARLGESGELFASRFSRVLSIFGGSQGQSALRKLNAQLTDAYQIDLGADVSTQAQQLGRAIREQGQSGLSDKAIQGLGNSLGGTANTREFFTFVRGASETLGSSLDYSGRAAEEFGRRSNDLVGLYRRLQGSVIQIINSINTSGVLLPLVAGFAAVVQTLEKFSTGILAISTAGQKFSDYIVEVGANLADSISPFREALDALAPVVDPLRNLNVNLIGLAAAVGAAVLTMKALGAIRNAGGVKNLATGSYIRAERALNPLQALARTQAAQANGLNGMGALGPGAGLFALNGRGSLQNGAPNLNPLANRFGGAPLPVVINGVAGNAGLRNLLGGAGSLSTRDQINDAARRSGLRLPGDPAPRGDLRPARVEEARQRASDAAYNREEAQRTAARAQSDLFRQQQALGAAGRTGGDVAGARAAANAAAANLATAQAASRQAEQGARTARAALNDYDGRGNLRESTRRAYPFRSLGDFDTKGLRTFRDQLNGAAAQARGAGSSMGGLRGGANALRAAFTGLRATVQASTAAQGAAGFLGGGRQLAREGRQTLNTFGGALTAVTIGAGLILEAKNASDQYLEASKNFDEGLSGLAVGADAASTKEGTEALRQNTQALKEASSGFFGSASDFFNVRFARLFGNEDQRSADQKITDSGRLADARDRFATQQEAYEANPTGATALTNAIELDTSSGDAFTQSIKDLQDQGRNATSIMDALHASITSMATAAATGTLELTEAQKTLIAQSGRVSILQDPTLFQGVAFTSPKLNPSAVNLNPGGRATFANSSTDIPTPTGILKGLANATNQRQDNATLSRDIAQATLGLRGIAGEGVSKSGYNIFQDAGPFGTRDVTNRDDAVKGFGNLIRGAIGNSASARFGNALSFGSKGENFAKSLNKLDLALTGLVRSGSAETAATAFTKLREEATKTGDISPKLFDKYFSNYRTAVEQATVGKSVKTDQYDEAEVAARAGGGGLLAKIATGRVDAVDDSGSRIGTGVVQPLSDDQRKQLQNTAETGIKDALNAGANFNTEEGKQQIQQLVQSRLKKTLEDLGLDTSTVGQLASNVVDSVIAQGGQFAGADVSQFGALAQAASDAAKAQAARIGLLSAQNAGADGVPGSAYRAPTLTNRSIGIQTGSSTAAAQELVKQEQQIYDDLQAAGEAQLALEVDPTKRANDAVALANSLEAQRDRIIEAKQALIPATIKNLQLLGDLALATIPDSNQTAQLDQQIRTLQAIYGAQTDPDDKNATYLQLINLAKQRAASNIADTQAQGLANIDPENDTTFADQQLANAQANLRRIQRGYTVDVQGNEVAVSGDQRSAAEAQSREAVRDAQKQAAARRQAADIARRRSLLAADDTLGSDTVDVDAARAEVSRLAAISTQTEAYFNAVAAYNTAVKKQADDTAARDYAQTVANIDPRAAFALAQAKMKEDQRVLATLTVGSQQYWEQYAAVVQDMIAAADALRATNLAAALGRIDITNDVATAQAEAQSAAAALADAIKQGAPAEVTDGLRNDARRARFSAENAAFQQQLSDVQTNDKLGRIAHSEYLAYLNAQHDRLTAQLSGLSTTSDGYRQAVDQLNQIDTLLDEAKKSVNQQFNLQDVTLPSLYEVRRAVGASADQIRTQVQDYSSTQGTVVINGADIGTVIAYINKTLGKGSTAVYTTTPRRI